MMRDREKSPYALNGQLPPRRHGEGANGSGPDFEPGTPEHREQVIKVAFMDVQGMSRKAAEKLYDKQLREWYAMQGKKPPKKKRKG